MRHPAWWLLAALLAGAAWALDPPRPPPPSAPAPAEPSAAQPETPAAEPPVEAAGAPPPDDEVLLPPPPGVGPTPQRFDPSEKVRADFPVSFPIDI